MNPVIPPSPNEYSTAEVKKAVITHGLKHPLTVFPIALSICLIFVGWLFQLKILFLSSFICFLIGPFFAILQIFFLFEKNGNKVIEKLNERQKEYEIHVKKLIEKGLSEHNENKDFLSYSEHGIIQFKIITEKLGNIHELLNNKLNTGEMTYRRFLGASEQVSLSVLDNLNKIVNILKSAGSIHTSYIKKRIDEITLLSEKSEEDIKQMKTLNDRLNLHENQIQSVKSLLTMNEEAMTEMEKISAAVAKWQTTENFADTDYESAIQKLHELAERAHEYE